MGVEIFERGVGAGEGSGGDVGAHLGRGANDLVWRGARGLPVVGLGARDIVGEHDRTVTGAVGERANLAIAGDLERVVVGVEA